MQRGKNVLAVAHPQTISIHSYSHSYSTTVMAIDADSFVDLLMELRSSLFFVKLAHPDEHISSPRWATPIQPYDHVYQGTHPYSAPTDFSYTGQCSLKYLKGRFAPIFSSDENTRERDTGKLCRSIDN